jgi:hypothetical protein
MATYLTAPGVTVKTKVCVAVPLVLVAVTVKVVMPATVPVQPFKRPFSVLKVNPAGAGLIAKLAMVPPVEVTVNPVEALFTARVSDEDESVKAGNAGATSTVRVNV